MHPFIVSVQWLSNNTRMDARAVSVQYMCAVSVQYMCVRGDWFLLLTSRNQSPNSTSEMLVNSPGKHPLITTNKKYENIIVESISGLNSIRALITAAIYHNIRKNHFAPLQSGFGVFSTSDFSNLIRFSKSREKTTQKPCSTFFFQLRKLGKLEPNEFFEKLVLGVS